MTSDLPGIGPSNISNDVRSSPPNDEDLLLVYDEDGRETGGELLRRVPLLCLPLDDDDELVLLLLRSGSDGIDFCNELPILTFNVQQIRVN
ncbi:unnamed protein product, partial [Nesidiocoris tenuis]